MSDRRAVWTGGWTATTRGGFALTLALVLGGTSCRSAAPQAPTSPASPEVVYSELRLEDGLPLVLGQLGADREGWFLVDSGSGEFTVIDLALSLDLDLEHEPVRSSETPFLEVRTRLKSLRVDGLERRNVKIYVDDFSLLPRLACLPILGVLGTGFFRGQCLEFDFAAHAFSAAAPRPREPSQAPLPLTWGPQGTLFGNLQIQGQPVSMLVDTGSRHSFLSPRLLQLLELAPREVPRHEAQDDEEAYQEVDIEHLALGGEVLENLRLRVSPRELPQTDLILGMDILSRYRILLDLSARPTLILGSRRAGQDAEPAATEAPGEAEPAAMAGEDDPPS